MIKTVGIIAPFLWWSINVVKYKIWAGNNVKDIHRFFEEAQSKNIISERAFLKRIEIKSSSQEKELLRFYNRLNSEKKIIKDINNDISKETIFKNGSKANIVVSILLIGGMFYLYESGEYNIKSVSIIGGVLMLFIGFDLYKRFKYNFVLKIDSKLISYKDDKTIIYWKDIISYNTIPGIQHNPSKLIINTKDENYELKLENYGTIKLGKIIDVLNENKHRFEINQSSSI